MIAKKKGIAIAASWLLAFCMMGGGASLMLASHKAAADDTPAAISQTYVHENVKIKNAPSVVCEVTNSTVLEGLKTAVANATARPASVILQLDKNGQIIDNAGNALGAFGAFLNETLMGKIIPVVRVETQDAADALVSFLNTTEVPDIAVTSNTPSLVKGVRIANRTVRGIVSFEKETDLATLVKTANENLATTVILPIEKATVENVRYLQARMKTVWVKTESNSEIALNDCIQSGACGVISSDFNAVYSAYERYGESVTRMPINVAYQSGKYFHNENSKLGAEKMLDNGANAVHMNVRLTKDKEIVFMADDSIDRTSNGEGKVSDYTKEQLQKFELDFVEGENEPIPSFDDVIPVFKTKNAVLWLELKEESANVITALAAELEEHDCYEQVVVWASDTAIESIQNEIPKVSTIIKRTTVDQQTVKDVAKYNSQVLYQISKNGESETVTVQEYLRDRGTMTFFWGGNSSYGLANGAAYDARTQEGVVGFIGNYAPYYKEKELQITGKSETRSALAVGDRVTVKVQSYNGTEIEASAKVFAVEDKGDSFLTVAVYESKLGIPLYSQSFTITKGEATGENIDAENNQNSDEDNKDKEKENSKVWLFVGLGSGITMLILGGVATTFIIAKKRGGKKDEE